MYSKVSYCTILIGAQHKFCKTKGSNSKVCSVQTPYKALLCKACKRLTKQSFVWREVLPPPARSFAASGEKFCTKFCRHTKLCFVRLANALQSKALYGEEFCTEFCRLRREIFGGTGKNDGQNKRGSYTFDNLNYIYFLRFRDKFFTNLLF